jgi:hypothetical protein
MKNTGIFANKEEIEELQGLAKTAQDTPVIAFSSEHALKEGGLSGQAWKRVHEKCYKTALAHGLPEIEGYYGLTQEGEFVTI